MHISKIAALIPISLLFVINSTMASELDAKMAKASNNLSQLMPYIYNDEAFRNKNNQAIITNHINELISVVDQTPHLLENHATTLQISQRSLANQLKQSKILFESGSYSTAQYLLSGVPAICSSCHIQDGQQAKMTQKMNRDLFANDFTYGEFNYYIRHYSEAEQAYKRHLSKGSIQKSRIQANKTLERLLDLAIITTANLTKAEELVEESKMLPKLNPETKQTLDTWQQSLANVSLKQQTLSELETDIYAVFDEKFTLHHEFIFEEKNRPIALIWRKQLHQHLRSPQSNTDTAKALYLLSIMERTLGNQSDISLANLYLKECMALKVKHYSSKCLNEYENHLHFYYGGSAGENLPPSILKELKELKQSQVKEI